MDRSVTYHAPPPAIAERADRFSALAGLNLTNQARWVIGMSDFAAKVAGNQRDWFAGALAGSAFDEPPQKDGLLSDLTAVDSAGDMDEIKRLLRRRRNQHQFHIVWRHLLGLASLEETVDALSFMADTFIHAALGTVERWETERHGQPVGASSGKPQHLAVLALGKLGGRELNLSSDIDLIFTYAEAGQTESGLSSQLFFTHVGQRLIEALHSVTEDGFVFRVDMRLRPHGTSGALVMHCGAMEQYFEREGRDWERYALIKARACAGDLAVGTALLDNIRPFVYRRYLDFGAVDALREMKAKRMASRRQADDLKQGAGGIRDAEFLVQVQQIMRGGQSPALQQPGFLQALAEIEDAGALDAGAAAQLRSAYRFLRHSEHSIQAEADQRGQRLPASDLGRLRLALSFGYADYEAYFSALAEQRANVQRLFEGLLHVAVTEFDQDLWALRTQPLALARAGFGDGVAASKMLMELAKAKNRDSVGAIGRRRLDELMPRLLHELSLSPDPTEILGRLLPILRTVLRRSTYMALLRDNPGAMERLISLVEASQWVANQIHRRPMLLDLLLEAPSTESADDRAALHESLGRRLANHSNEEAWLEELRLFKEQHVFKVAMAEVLGDLPLMHVSDDLTHLAAAVLEHGLRLAWDQCEARYGPPEGVKDRPFIVVGYGKLGGLELGPGSDLDLVFLHDMPPSTAQFAHRLTQKLLHYLTVPTYIGPLYTIDTRLRPSGGAGTLVSSLEGFKQYQQSRAWVWEHQALVRARAVAGDPALIERFEKLRRELLCIPRSLEALRSEVTNMRARMAAHQGEDQDLKGGVGGIVDVEFMVQYLVLAQAHNAPKLAVYSDNVRILETAATVGLLSENDAESLIRAYLTLRAQRHRDLLDLSLSDGAGAAMATHIAEVTRIWQWLFGSKRR